MRKHEQDPLKRPHGESKRGSEECTASVLSRVVRGGGKGAEGSFRDDRLAEKVVDGPRPRS